MNKYKFMYYSNKNLPRTKLFEFRLYEECAVLMFRWFDVSFWWANPPF